MFLLIIKLIDRRANISPYLLLLKWQLNAFVIVPHPRIVSKQKCGGNPGQVVMGGDSCSKGHEFESWHSILDGHFFTYLFAVKIVFVKTKINEKEAGVGSIKKNNRLRTKAPIPEIRAFLKLGHPRSASFSFFRSFQTNINFF